MAVNAVPPIMSSKVALIGSFIESAPPGELADVVSDVRALTSRHPDLLALQDSSFQKYNEEQFVTGKLPDSQQEVVVSPYNSLKNGRYLETQTSTSFHFNHLTHEIQDSQTHPLASQYANILTSALEAFNAHASEHYPSSSVGVYPYENDSKIALVLVANKYSPSNFWNGRWRSQYIVNPQLGSISGIIKVDVHYYEDGNVRLLTEKPINFANDSSSGEDIVRQIAMVERKYQEDLNRAFAAMSEETFKGLRRQLPVTRQKVEWGKISGYRLGQDIGGGKSG